MAWDSSIAEVLRGRRVLVTGHTGFKGAWLALWLELLGAEVVGLSLPPESQSLYERAELAGRWDEFLCDVRDLARTEVAVAEAQPDLVLHLAAQPLVSRGYAGPLETFETNVLGTAHILEAVRRQGRLVPCVVVTTDKVYRPAQVAHRHVEVDALGATDPYSASKAAAEHVVSAWRELAAREHLGRIVAARAGNVIGGGDFAPDRLLPDLVRAFSSGEVCRIRHPEFTRPWQHVLDPLAGYLALAARLLEGQEVPDALNFGPECEESVRVVAEMATHCWGGSAEWTPVDDNFVPETPLLALNSDLARRELGWEPTWDTEQAVNRTISWWKSQIEGESPLDLCYRDISAFMSHSDVP